MDGYNSILRHPTNATVEHQLFVVTGHSTHCPSTTANVERRIIFSTGHGIHRHLSEALSTETVKHQPLSIGGSFPVITTTLR
ncbi:hypothetical protein PtB15_14B232 [Puccinia triticina]|nr:hypothetical protein PtB15_14B232 [Puccinia triticina]